MTWNDWQPGWLSRIPPEQLTAHIERIRRGQDGDERTCSRCGETKPAGAFYPHWSRPGWLRSECKACTRARRGTRRRANSPVERRVCALVECGSTFTVYTNNRGQRFCSIRCGTRGRRTA